MGWKSHSCSYDNMVKRMQAQKCILHFTVIADWMYGLTALSHNAIGGGKVLRNKQSLLLKTIFYQVACSCDIHSKSLLSFVSE